MGPETSEELLKAFLLAVFGQTSFSRANTYGIELPPGAFEHWPNGNFFPNKINGRSRINDRCIKGIELISDCAIRSKGTGSFQLYSFAGNLCTLINGWFDDKPLDAEALVPMNAAINVERLHPVQIFWKECVSCLCNQMISASNPDYDCLYRGVKKALESYEKRLLESGKPEVLDSLKNHVLDMKRRGGTYYLAEISQELYPDIDTELGAGEYSSHGIDYPSLWTYLTETDESATKKHAMLVGEGGIGKTVSIQEAAIKAITNGHAAVFIPLNAFTCMPLENEGYIESYIHRTIFKGSDDLHASFIALCEAQDSERVFIFLDGWNEIGTTSVEFMRKVRTEIEDVWMAMDNVRVILSGRERADKAMRWTRGINYIKAEPLKKASIEAYLESREVTPPPTQSDLWTTLANPLMITLYTDTAKQKQLLCGMAGSSYINDEPRASTQSAILWNFIQCQVAKFSSETEDSPFDTSMALIYVAGMIGYRMHQLGRFGMFGEEILNELFHHEDLASNWFRSYYCTEQLVASNKNAGWNYIQWLAILRNKAFVLNGAEQEDGSLFYSFMHQKFRDFFAAVYMRVFSRPFSEHDEPTETTCWNDSPKEAEVLNLLAPLFKQKELSNLWAESTQKSTDTVSRDNYSTFNLLELFRRQNIEYGSLEYSNRDLRTAHFYTYGTDLLACNFQHSMVGADTFLSAADNDNVEYVAFLNRHESKLKFATASETAVFIWDARTGSINQSLELAFDDGIVVGLETLPGRSCFCIATTRKVLVWGLDDKVAASVFEHDDISSIAPLPSLKKMLVRISEANEFYLLDLPCDSDCTGIVELTSARALDAHRLFKFGSTTESVFAGTKDSRVFVYSLDIDSGIVKQIASHRFDKTISDISIDEQSGLVLCCLSNGAVYSYDYSSNICRRLFFMDGSIYGVCFSPTGLLLAAAFEGEIRLYDSYSGKLLDLFNQDTLHDASAALVQFFAFSSDEQYLLCGHATNAVSVWDLTQANYLGAKKPMRVTQSSKSELLFEPLYSDGCFMLATSDGFMYWFNPKTKKIEDCGDFDIKDELIEALAIDPSGKLLFMDAGGATMHLYKYEGESFKAICSTDCMYQPERIYFSSDSKYIFIAASNAYLCVLKTSDLSIAYAADIEDLVSHAIAITALAPLSDSRLLAVTDEGRVSIFGYSDTDDGFAFTSAQREFVVDSGCTELSTDKDQNWFSFLEPTEEITICDASFNIEDSYHPIGDDEDVFSAVEDDCLEFTRCAQAPSGNRYAFTLDRQDFGGTAAIVLYELNAHTSRIIDLDDEDLLDLPVFAMCFSDDGDWLGFRFGNDGFGLIDCIEGTVTTHHILPTIRVFKADFTGATFEDADTPRILRENGAIVDDEPIIVEREA